MANEDAEVQLVAPSGEVVASEPMVEVIPQDDPHSHNSEELAYEVIAGHWGVGDSNIRRRLKKAGIKAGPVMAEVARLQSTQ
jgi:hypothetical protein